MSVDGLCQICETATATHRCSRCGSLVCSDHYDTATGYCTDCAAEVGTADAGE